MTKLEEVARAIHAAHSNDDADYEDLARAAIEALREPSPGMVEAWSNARPDVTIEDDDERWTDENCARADWNAMTDALLAEKE